MPHALIMFPRLVEDHFRLLLGGVAEAFAHHLTDER